MTLVLTSAQQAVMCTQHSTLLLDYPQHVHTTQNSNFRWSKQLEMEQHDLNLHLSVTKL
jgi:hypothetical protein